MIKHSNFKRRWKDVKDDIIEGFNKIHAKEKVVNGLYTEQVEQKLKTASKRKFAVLCSMVNSEKQFVLNCCKR